MKLVDFKINICISRTPTEQDEYVTNLYLTFRDSKDEVICMNFNEDMLEKFTDDEDSFLTHKSMFEILSTWRHLGTPLDIKQDTSPETDYPTLRIQQIGSYLALNIN